MSRPYLGGMIRDRLNFSDHIASESRYARLNMLAPDTGCGHLATLPGKLQFETKT